MAAQGEATGFEGGFSESRGRRPLELWTAVEVSLRTESESESELELELELELESESESESNSESKSSMKSLAISLLSLRDMRRSSVIVVLSLLRSLLSFSPASVNTPTTN